MKAEMSIVMHCKQKKRLLFVISKHYGFGRVFIPVTQIDIVPKDRKNFLLDTMKG